jgi:hypothetical protein
MKRILSAILMLSRLGVHSQASNQSPNFYNFLNEYHAQHQELRDGHEHAEGGEEEEVSTANKQLYLPLSIQVRQMLIESVEG